MAWTFINDSEKIPDNFLFSGISAGLKVSKKKDLALILAPPNSIFTGFFTNSAVRASCVDICISRLQESLGLVRAILINSGQANACTGDKGLIDSLAATKELGDILGISESQILMCSTGVIGEPIPMKKLINKLPLLVNKLDERNFKDASEAILTTDLVTKSFIVERYIAGRRIRIAGFAKGSGMIYPNMATMLAFIVCDVGIEKKTWDAMLKDSLQTSFNSISVDGETSTNDSFIAINSGELIEKQYLPIIHEGIDMVCEKLAKSIVRDGEGANCLIEVIVENAKNKSDALKIAKSISNSMLVKTAIHGCDPNWGRIIGAAGNTGVQFKLNDVDLFIGEFQILRKGNLTFFDKEKVGSYIKSKMNGDYLVNDIVRITLNLNQGKSKSIAWGCDLSKKYVEINSEYTT